MKLAPSPGEHEIDAAAAALRAFEPLDPIDHRQLGAQAGLGKLDPRQPVGPDPYICLRQGACQGAATLGDFGDA